jgi:subtilisin family serine protease
MGDSNNGTDYQEVESGERPTEKLSEHGSRFLSKELIAASFSRLTPGVVEVQFVEGMRPDFSRTDTNSFRLTFDSDIEPLIEGFFASNTEQFETLLQKNQVVNVERTFRTPPTEAFDVWFADKERGLISPDLSSYFTLHFAPDADTKAIARELAAQPLVVRAAALPRTAPAGGQPSDPLLGTAHKLAPASRKGLENQWYIFRCRADSAWKRGFTGKNVVVADLDWGFFTGHLDIQKNLNLKQAYNSSDESPAVSQGGSIDHGTAVLGLIGASADDFGMVGFAPDAELWPIQVNRESVTDIDPTSWARAIEHVIFLDAKEKQGGGEVKRKIILLEGQTLAGGNIESIISIHGAIQKALSENLVVCVAAGNNGVDATLDDDGHPFTPSGAIIIGGTNYDENENPPGKAKNWETNWGGSVVVSAPGDDLHDLTCSDKGKDRYRNSFGGTSGAAAKVAGAVALMLQASPTLDHSQIREILGRTGSKIITDPLKPIGSFLDVEAAINKASEHAASISAPDVHE